MGWFWVRSKLQKSEFSVDWPGFVLKSIGDIYVTVCSHIPHLEVTGVVSGAYLITLYEEQGDIPPVAIDDVA